MPSHTKPASACVSVNEHACICYASLGGLCLAVLAGLPARVDPSGNPCVDFRFNPAHGACSERYRGRKLPRRHPVVKRAPTEATPRLDCLQANNLLWIFQCALSCDETSELRPSIPHTAQGVKNRASFGLSGDFGEGMGVTVPPLSCERRRARMPHGAPFGLGDSFPRRWCHGNQGGVFVQLLAPVELGRAASKVAHDHFGFAHNAIHVITPPLEHLLSLLCELGNDIHGAYANGLMAQSLFDHVTIETALG